MLKSGLKHARMSSQVHINTRRVVEWNLFYHDFLSVKCNNKFSAV